MNRFKSVVLTLVAALGIVSCEAESIDEHTQNLVGEYKPIFAFDLNGQRRVTDDVTVDWLNTSSFEVIAKVRDSHSAYRVDEVRITYSALMLGTYSWERSLEAFDLYSKATLKIDGLPFTYDSNNAPVAITQAGFASIDNINYNSNYMGGKFEYTLYPSLRYEEEYAPISIRNGVFEYVKYK